PKCSIMLPAPSLSLPRKRGRGRCGTDYRNGTRMTDLLLGLASPEFWRNCGSALVALGVIGVAGVIFLSDAKRGMQKGLALLCIATLLVGLALARFGESALLAEARERASVARSEERRVGKECGARAAAGRGRRR